MTRNIILIGLSGTGKTTVGALLAQALDRVFLDTDALIERAAGCSIPEMFAQAGEAHFRQRENAALTEALQQPGAVIATGAGIIEYADNLPLMETADVIWLRAMPETLATRLAASTDRPLLRSDPLGALRDQATRRTPIYNALANHQISTDQHPPADVASEIHEWLKRQAETQHEKLTVQTPGGTYDVIIAPHALAALPSHLAQLVPRGRVWIVSDTHVWPRYGARLQRILEGAGVVARGMAIPAGETSKHLQTVGAVYDWLLGSGVERGDALIAFGGGVVGDLAGFVAATALRGIAFIQIPTTVLAIVDSSIGGKTGVDHAVGKNLIGAFYQPRLVLADTTLLKTLSEDERRSGWTEAIKHGVIADAELFEQLTHNEPALRALEEPITSRLLRHAASIKVNVVSEDEREQGARMLLNYGHTIGHALERWSDYRIRHGEAVAMGMGVAAEIAHRIGLCDTDLQVRQEATLRAFGLPTRLPSEAEPRDLLAAARSDKKVQYSRQRWVLPTAIGAATVRADVDESIVLGALAERRLEATTD